MTYLCFTGACKDLEIVLGGDGLYWGHQLRQDISEWKHWLVAAGKAPCPARVRDKAIMGMLGRGGEGSRKWSRLKDRTGRRRWREQG